MKKGKNLEPKNDAKNFVELGSITSTIRIWIIAQIRNTGTGN